MDQEDVSPHSDQQRDPERTLTPEEREDFVRAEERIERGLKTFVEVGLELANIRDRRLYREDYHRFEDYCRSRWGLGPTSVYYYTEGAKVYENLRLHNCETLPVNPFQVRPLLQLTDPEQQVAAWKDAARHRESVKITGEAVGYTVTQIKRQLRAPLEATMQTGAKGGTVTEEDETKEEGTEEEATGEQETRSIEEHPAYLELKKMNKRDVFNLMLHATGGTVLSMFAVMGKYRPGRMKRDIPPIVAHRFPNETIQALLPEQYDLLHQRAQDQRTHIRALLAEVVRRGLEREEGQG